MPEEDVATEEELEQEELTEEEQEMAKLKEAISVEVEDIGTLRKKLTITLPCNAIDERRNEQFSELKRDSTVPGFRKGHAPMRLIEKRFGSEVSENLSSRLLSSSYLAAVEKEDLKTIGDPMIWAKDEKSADPETEKLVTLSEAFDLITLPTDGDLTFSCEVEIRPEFELPQLEGIEIQQPKIEIGSAQVKEQIDRLRGMRGHYEPVSQDKVKEDDLVICKIKISADDKVLHEEENCQLAARPLRYAGILMEDLGKTLKGAKVGDQKELAGQIPEDYQEESARGKTAKVELAVLDIKRLVLPELDDEFLSSLGFEAKKELEEWVKTNLESQKNEEVRRGKREQAYKYLMDNTTLDLPEATSQRQTERIVARRMLELAQRGVPEAEIIKQADAIKTGAAEDAVKDLKLHFILEKIAEDWEVDISEDEINSQIAAIAQRQNRRFDRVRDELIRNKNLPSLYAYVRDEKIVDRIIDQAKIVETDAPKKKKSTQKKTTRKKPKSSKNT